MEKLAYRLKWFLFFQLPGKKGRERNRERERERERERVGRWNSIPEVVASGSPACESAEKTKGQ